jgi:hypothetical protein
VTRSSTVDGCGGTSCNESSTEEEFSGLALTGDTETDDEILKFLKERKEVFKKMQERQTFSSNNL